MKLLSEFMDDISIARGFSSFKDFNTAFKPNAQSEMILFFMMEAAEKYAMYMAHKAWNEGNKNETEENPYRFYI